MNTLDANDKRGLFAKYQPVYAAHAVVTLPVEAEHKKPFVRHPQCFGLPASRKVAAKFPDANAFGFWAGHRNKLSVLDVDDTDERVLADAFSRHGGTPLVVRTASKFHAYYRHGGERRRIRPWRDLPIDLLGAGLCLAPPSVTGKGAYEIIAGSLDDLDRLPIMRGLDSEFYQRSESSPKNKVSRTVEPGQRNNSLFRHCMREAHHVECFDALLDVARTFQHDDLPPAVARRRGRAGGEPRVAIYHHGTQPFRQSLGSVTRGNRRRTCCQTSGRHGSSRLSAQSEQA